MAICYIGLGSNLGNRRRNIKLALEKIASLKGTRVLKTSSIIETIPEGGPCGQNKFLNAAAKIDTVFSPGGFLKCLKKIETALGRVKTVRNGPRPIDLDILFFGDRMIRTKDLVVPHPRLFKRKFVLKPLSEVI